MTADELCPKCGARRTVVGYFLGPSYSHNPDDVQCLRNQLEQHKQAAHRREVELRQAITGALLFLEQGMPERAQQLLEKTGCAVIDLSQFKPPEPAPEAEHGDVATWVDPAGVVWYGVKYHLEVSGAVVGQVWQDEKGWKAKRIEYRSAGNIERTRSDSDLGELLRWLSLPRVTRRGW